MSDGRIVFKDSSSDESVLQSLAEGYETEFNEPETAAHQLWYALNWLQNDRDTDLSPPEGDRLSAPGQELVVYHQMDAGPVAALHHSHAEPITDDMRARAGEHTTLELGGSQFNPETNIVHSVVWIVPNAIADEFQPPAEPSFDAYETDTERTEPATPEPDSREPTKSEPDDREPTKSEPDDQPPEVTLRWSGVGVLVVSLAVRVLVVEPGLLFARSDGQSRASAVVSFIDALLFMSITLSVLAIVASFVWVSKAGISQR